MTFLIGEQANSVLSTVYSISIPPLQVGQRIGVAFRNPTDGRVGLTLATNEEDFALRLAFRVNFRGDVNQIIASSRKDRVWSRNNYLVNSPMPEIGTTTRIVVFVTVEEDGFAISTNEGEILGFFPYAATLTYDKVTSIWWGAADESATKKSVLREISINFPRQE